MLEVIVFVGLQGAGKSTFYGQRFAATHVLVSKDRLRNNRRPERRQQRLIFDALAAGRSVVVDNTNPSVSERAAIVETGRSCGARLVAYFFMSSMEECLLRNGARSGTARVPDVGLFATVKKLVAPSRDEGFHELWSVRTLPDFQFETHPLTESSSNESR
jgi:predicted kinase